MKDKTKDGSSLIYRVKFFSDFTEPYSYSEDLDNIVTHKTYDEYVVHNEKTFYDTLNEFLDAPKKPLTSKDIRKDFDSPNRKISDTKVEAIKTYYNGRYTLSKKIYSTLKKIDFSKITSEQPVILKFNIPFSMNYFSTEDNDPYDEHVKMNAAFIEIEISSDSISR